MVSATSSAHVPPLTIFDYSGVVAKMVTADFGLQKCCSEITGHITDTTSSSFLIVLWFLLMAVLMCLFLYKFCCFWVYQLLVLIRLLAVHRI